MSSPEIRKFRGFVNQRRNLRYRGHNYSKSLFISLVKRWELTDLLARMPLHRSCGHVDTHKIAEHMRDKWRDYRTYTSARHNLSEMKLTST